MKLMNVSSVKIYLSILSFLGFSHITASDKPNEPKNPEHVELNKDKPNEEKRLTEEKKEPAKEIASVQVESKDLTRLKDKLSGMVDVLQTKTKEAVGDAMCKDSPASLMKCQDTAQPGHFTFDGELIDKNDVYKTLKDDLNKIAENLVNQDWNVVQEKKDKDEKVTQTTELKVPKSVGGMAHSPAAVRAAIVTLNEGDTNAKPKIKIPQGVKWEDVQTLFEDAAKEIYNDKLACYNYQTAYDKFKKEHSDAIASFIDSDEKQMELDRHALIVRETMNIVTATVKEILSSKLSWEDDKTINPSTVGAKDAWEKVAYLLKSADKLKGVSGAQNPFVEGLKGKEKLIFDYDKAAEFIVKCLEKGDESPLNDLPARLKERTTNFDSGMDILKKCFIDLMHPMSPMMKKINDAVQKAKTHFKDIAEVGQSSIDYSTFSRLREKGYFDNDKLSKMKAASTEAYDKLQKAFERLEAPKPNEEQAKNANVSLPYFDLLFATDKAYSFLGKGKVYKDEPKKEEVKSESK